MLKKIFTGFLLTAALSIFLLSACAAPVIDVVFKDIPKETPKPEETVALDDETETAPEFEKFSMYDETIGQLMVALDEATVIQVYGDADQTSEPKLVASDGLVHKTSTYGRLGLELDYVEINDVYVINTVVAKAPFDGKTSRGIGIGSSEAEINAVYGDDINAEEMQSFEGKIIVGTIYGGLIFTMDSGAVSAMFLGAGAE